MVGASGFERIEQEWLLSMLEALPRPWPTGALLAWLRYVSRQMERGLPAWCPGVAPRPAQELRTMPGRRLVAQVAGVPEWAAREALDGKAWVDPLASQRPPGALPAASRGAPSRLPPGRREAAPTQDRPSQSPPSHLPAASQSHPGGLPYTRGSSCTDTDTDTGTRTTPPPALNELLELAAEVLGEDSSPSERKAATGPIRRLAREAGLSAAELAEQLPMVAKWAREAPEPAASRSIRGLGLPGGTDRSRSTATLCDTDRWAERVRAARRWAARAAATTVEPVEPRQSPMETVYGLVLALIESDQWYMPNPGFGGATEQEYAAAVADAVSHKGEVGLRWKAEVERRGAQCR